MTVFARPTIFISSCIEFEKCRYDGGIIHNEFVERLIPFIDVIRVCPEMSIGLGSPRDAIRQVKRDSENTKLLSTIKGVDYTLEMNEFVRDYLNKLASKEVDGFILKAKSPTCGTSNIKIYENYGKAKVITTKGEGFFGGKVKEKYPGYPIETEMRMTNYIIRDKFYTEIFTLADFKAIKRKLQLKDLINFHAKNKYLFMTYNQITLNKLGNIVANTKKYTNEEIFIEYEDILRELLSKTPTQKRRINVLSHIYGYFKKDLNVEEKEYYFEVLDDYINNQKNYTNVLIILRSWAIRFKNEYLMKQTIFQPYPKELIVELDSGKKI